MITFSAPGVTPAYIWPMSSIVNGQVPTTPPLKTYGNIVVSGNGLLLEDESAYLNAGDFQGNLHNFIFFTQFDYSKGLFKLNFIFYDSIQVYFIQLL